MEVLKDFVDTLVWESKYAEKDVSECELIISESVTPKISHALNNFASFYSKIKDFYVDDKYTDVRIRCHDQIFNCHRIILAAASKYFDTMFYGGLKGFVENHAKEISIHDIDVEAFQEVLRFAYNGVVRITDDNVYNLLHVSEMLELTFVENECVRYLAAYGVPPNYALDIYAFSHSLQKYSLLPIVSRYIMKNLDRYSRHRDFLKFSFEELKTLLAYWEASSENEEISLLSALARWVSNFTSISRQSRTFSVSNFIEYINFQHLSVEYVENYCLKFDSNYGECSINDILFTSDFNLDAEFDKSHLHVYVNTMDEIIDDPVNFDTRLSRTNLFTFQGSSENMTWCPLRESTLNLTTLRSVTLDDQLYCVKTLGRASKFIVCSSLDLSDARPLNVPLISRFFFPDLCGHQNFIYGAHSDCTPQKLLMYYRDLDKWSSPSAESETSCPSIACDGNRVFHFGGFISGKTHRYTRDVQAYDHRAGNWTNLTKSVVRHSAFDRSSTHEGKIYVSCSGTNKSDLLDVYDLRADKWEVIRMKHSLGNENELRLTSYDKQLWVVSSKKRRFHRPDEPDSIQVQVYDSFLQEWITSDTLDHVAKNETCKNGKGFLHILDVVQFKPL